MALRLSMVIEGQDAGGKKVIDDTTAAVTRLEKASDDAGRKVATGIAPPQVANNVRLTNQQLSQMQFQLQDMAVGLASGQSPFMVMMQQGSQVAQMFQSGTGVTAALRAVGTGIVAFVSNPLNLALLGFSSLAGVASLAFRAISGGAGDAEDALERHRELIKEIRDTWPEAAKAAEGYGRESVAVMEAQLRGSAAALAAKLREEGLDAIDDLGTEFANRFQGRFFLPDAEFEPFGEAIRQLRDELKAGEPDIRAFRDRVATLANAEPENRELQRLKDRLFELTKEAFDNEAALDAARAMIGQLGGAAAAEAARIDRFASAMRDLQKISLPDLSEREQALQAFQRARNQAGNREERDDALLQYEAALGRIATAEKKAADEKAARLAITGGNRTAEEVEREHQSVQGLIGSLSEEYALIGVSNREKAVQNALRQAGAAATAAEREEIRQLVEGIYDQQDAQQSMVARWDAARGTFGSMLSTFRQGMRAGQGFFDSLTAAASRLETKLWEIAENQLIALLFGKQGMGGGGFIGSLFRGVEGGGFGTGGGGFGGIGGIGSRAPAISGIARSPAAVARLGGSASGGGGAAVHFAPVTSINVQGSADSSTLAALRDELDRRDQGMRETLPELIRQARQDRRI